MSRSVPFLFAVLCGVSFLVNVTIPSGFAHEKGYEITIPQAIVPPKIDGKLDDAVWQAAVPVEWGNINEGGEVDKDQFTRSWAVYDDEFIYVAFENMESDTDNLLTAVRMHDGGVWNDDENELFIEPGNAGAAPYFHIMINAANVTEDAENGGMESGWEPDLESETRILKDRWILEVKIPFEDLGYDEPPVGETWGWNFNRHIMTGAGVWTGWSTTGASFHTPERFGDLTFGLDRVAVQPCGKLAGIWGRIRSFRR
jgi:hypothetical protein